MINGLPVEDERRDAGGREDLPGFGHERGLLGRRFGGDLGGGHFCMPASRASIDG